MSPESGPATFREAQVVLCLKVLANRALTQQYFVACTNCE